MARSCTNEQDATQRLIHWAFGPGLLQVRSVLGSDPVVRCWIGMCQPPFKKLSVLFDEGNGARLRWSLPRPNPAALSTCASTRNDSGFNQLSRQVVHAESVAGFAKSIGAPNPSLAR